YDATSGGKWRFVSHDQHGNEFAFHGCIHEVNPNTRLIQTFEFEGLSESGHVALERAEFASKGDNETEIRITSTFQSVEDRDGMVASGMESGFRKSIDALDALLVS
ncbi:MAG TPA: SRPBCC domain-containing protein, partial [Patescibacteria group bacterium]